MTIKQIVNDLLNKKWSLEDLIWLILICIISSTFTTPLLGVPIGIIVYFLLFSNDEDFDETAEKNNFQDKNKK
ncbi:hypothetical protein AXY37_12315 [Mammaliicoccus lentus]|uniref:VraH family protein n=1 Tax=Mammaliicoccus lentus TaxID=42858 RepID=A0AAX3W643_MAMLE|nr:MULTISPECIES: hypothetical protein [Mammaliicoccus]HBV03252.1 hypothetical protein [Staphylococcus sp.]MBF0795322.1 VraH family protein [Mammaliicoccus lentus]MBW0766888.1 VraH family protein [Mammaliicoccus lentus]MCD2478677.1 VraH family protein [Mammaliicoccus lentus]MCD2520938.1 VraH family protein [Mammaliicoccus lentus]